MKKTTILCTKCFQRGISELVCCCKEVSWVFPPWSFCNCPSWHISCWVVSGPHMHGLSPTLDVMRNTEVLTYYCQWGRQALLLLLQTCAFLGGGTVVLHMQHALPEHLQPQPGKGSGAVQGQNTAKTKPTRKYKTKWKTRYSWTSLAAKTYSCCTDLKTVRDIINKRRASFNRILRDSDLQPTITVKPSKLTAESHQFQAGHLAVYKNQNSELERAYCLVQCSQHVVGMLTGAERGKKSLGKNVLKQSRLLYPQDSSKPLYASSYCKASQRGRLGVPFTKSGTTERWAPGHPSALIFRGRSESQVQSHRSSGRWESVLNLLFTVTWEFF